MVPLPLTTSLRAFARAVVILRSSAPTSVRRSKGARSTFTTPEYAQRENAGFGYFCSVAVPWSLKDIGRLSGKDVAGRIAMTSITSGPGSRLASANSLTSVMFTAGTCCPPAWSGFCSVGGTDRQVQPHASRNARSSSAGGFHNCVTISSPRSLAFSRVSCSICFRRPLA